MATDTQTHVSTDGTTTGLVGYLYAAYDTLVSWFGEPDPDVSDEDEVNAEWTLVAPSSAVVSVYDFGDVGSGGATVRGRYLNACCQTMWHVGAASEQAARELLGDAFTPCAEALVVDDPEWNAKLRTERPAELDGARRVAV